jgi:hypothetical protein
MEVMRSVDARHEIGRHAADELVCVVIRGEPGDSKEADGGAVGAELQILRNRTW